MAGREQRKYDESEDEVLAVYKAREGFEGVLIELRSYKGAEPRIKVTRYYYDEKTSKWTPDFQRVFPRFRMLVLSWLFSAEKDLTRAFDEWTTRNKGGKGKAKTANAFDNEEAPKKAGR